MKWEKGCATIDELIREGRLERISGHAANGNHLIRSAEALLSSASRELHQNPEAAYVLIYDAARKAATALLLHQGLRPKSSGHHVTVEQAVRAQFGGPFSAFGALRRRRGEIEYPQGGEDEVTSSEAEQALHRGMQISAAAKHLIEELDLY
ncbi:MAG: hypothetical protein ACRC0L_11755 [Angustibacter sp.]